MVAELYKEEIYGKEPVKHSPFYPPPKSGTARDIPVVHVFSSKSRTKAQTPLLLLLNSLPLQDHQ